MEITQTEKKKNTKRKTQSSTVPIRINKDLAKRIKKELTKVNQKQFGRKVRASEYIDLAIGLVTSGHHKKLQEGTLTNADRIERSYREYCDKNGHISKDKYLGILLSSDQSTSLDRRFVENAS